MLDEDILGPKSTEISEGILPALKPWCMTEWQGEEQALRGTLYLLDCEFFGTAVLVLSCSTLHCSVRLHPAQPQGTKAPV